MHADNDVKRLIQRIGFQPQHTEVDSSNRDAKATIIDCYFRLGHVWMNLGVDEQHVSNLSRQLRR